MKQSNEIFYLLQKIKSLHHHFPVLRLFLQQLSSVYKRIFKHFFFLLPPETAHHFTVSLLEFILKFPGAEWLMRKIFCFKNSALEKKAFGITFPNPVGLAAGFDKDARHLRAMSCLGFGSIEVGTVTPLPQPGNPKPRLFRLPKDEALINRMGFNNRGVDVAAMRLKNFRAANHFPLVIGGNIGKNKATPNEDAIRDYEICFEKLFDWVDYFVVNVSSPNTPGLRELQEKAPLKKILLRLQEINQSHEPPKPILLKIDPDLPNNQLDDIIEIVIETNLAGVIATNTTVTRNDLRTPPLDLEKTGAGGLSGKPIAKRSTELIRYIKSKSQNKFAIIGVGGIQTAKDAIEKINAGADLIQVYTGMIYEGPGIVKRILKQIQK
jgi:dihydroorotate dehydrogenase